MDVKIKIKKFRRIVFAIRIEMEMTGRKFRG